MILDAVISRAGGYALAVLERDLLDRVGDLTWSEAPDMRFEPLKDDAADVLQAHWDA